MGISAHRPRTKPILIAHLSDPHICPDGQLYQSVLDTTRRFAKALAQAASFCPDLLIVSGELSEYGDAESCAQARGLLSTFQRPSSPSPATATTVRPFARASPICRP